MYVCMLNVNKKYYPGVNYTSIEKISCYICSRNGENKLYEPEFYFILGNSAVVAEASGTHCNYNKLIN